MFINALRVFFFGLPLAAFLWFAMATNSFMATTKEINKLQGPTGLLVINSRQDGVRTWGKAFSEGLHAIFKPEEASDWNAFYDKMGMDLDQMILFIEAYWIWIILGVVFGGGFLYAMAPRKY